MDVLGWLKRVVVSTARLPLRGIDWTKTKLGYISVPPLREFVYLDETSVISLIASTTGGVTEQKSTVKRRQISGSITGGLGDKTTSLSSTVGATQEKSSEAVRRYVIQSNFKELYEMRADDMVIYDEYEPRRSIPGRVWNGLMSVGSDEPAASQIEFERGSLAEINVNLGSHEVYDFYSAIASLAEMFDIFPDDSEFADELGTQEFSIEELEAFGELFEHLLAGLVPLVGEVENYGVVVEDGSPAIVPNEYAIGRETELDPLHIVGFVNSDKFWQEETRFLFDNDKYTVYCRLDDGEVSKDWMPIKLVSVVDSIFSGLGESVRGLPEAFENPGSNVDEGDETKIDLRPRLDYFVEVLEEEVNLEIDPDAADEIIQVVITDIGETTTKVEVIEEAVERFEQELSTREYDYNPDSWERDDFMDDILARDFDKLSQDRSQNEWYLEVSFTAIYW